MSIGIGRSTRNLQRNIPAACVPSKECVSVESGLGNSFTQRKPNIGKIDTLWTIMPSRKVSISILYFINSWTTIVFSIINISDIKMGLLIDSILDLMKCDKRLCLCYQIILPFWFLALYGRGVCSPAALPVVSGGKLESVDKGEAKVFLPFFLCLGKSLCCHASPAPVDSAPVREAWSPTSWNLMTLLPLFVPSVLGGSGFLFAV